MRFTARRNLWWGVVLGALLFLLLTLDELFHGFLYRGDFTINDAMTRWAAAWPTVHDIGNGLSQPGSGVVATAVVAGCAVLLALWRDWRRCLWLVAGSVAGAVAVTVLKPAIGRPLPPFIATRFPHGYGFPSGHTIGATVSLGLAILLVTEAWISRRPANPARAAVLRKQAVAAWVTLSFVVGVARVLAQHHWLSDVLGAWSLGGALVCATLMAAGEWRGPRPFFSSASRPVPMRSSGPPGPGPESAPDRARASAYEDTGARTSVRVIGFTGMPGSGKSEAMEVARAQGIPVVRMGDLIWEEVERQGKPRDAKHVGEVANAMRSSHGKDVWAVRTVERVRQQAEGHPLVLIDGIRSNDEVETFRRELGDDFVLVAIHTDPEHRFGRMVRRARADDSPDHEVLKARDEREMNWGLARTIALADEMLVNDGTLEAFRRKVATLLERTRKALG